MDKAISDIFGMSISGFTGGPFTHHQVYFSDALGMVAHPFKVCYHTQYGSQGSQINRHGLLGSDKKDALLFNVKSFFVDQGVILNDLFDASMFLCRSDSTDSFMAIATMSPIVRTSS